jgi:hypothetical protein
MFLIFSILIVNNTLIDKLDNMFMLSKKVAQRYKLIDNTQFVYDFSVRPLQATRSFSHLATSPVRPFGGACGSKVFHVGLSGVSY